jgi:hypothetical protein
MSTIKVSKDTQRRLFSLKGELMERFEQSFTFDEIVNALLEYLEHSTEEMPAEVLESYLILDWPIQKELPNKKRKEPKKESVRP